MRKYLGVLAVVAALCVMSWAQTPAPAQDPAAQAPAQTPSQTPAQTPATGPPAQPTPISTPAPTPPPPPRPFPRFEIFGGGSYAEAGLFNAGHWASLGGWDASMTVNAVSWLGFVVDGGQYYGTSKIPIGAPEPFDVNPCAPNCTGPTFNVSTKEYNILFGVQFSKRKYDGWVPFGDLLYGHQGTRGIENFPTGPPDQKVGTGPAFVAGGGLDRRINERFALRLKADYLQTNSQFPGFPKMKQDNFRFSIGVVIRSVHKKKRKLEDETGTEP